MSPILSSCVTVPILTPLVSVRSSDKHHEQISDYASDCDSMGSTKSHDSSSYSNLISVAVTNLKPKIRKHEYDKAQDVLSDIIGLAYSDIDVSVAEHLKDQLRQCTLNKKDLFIASHLLKRDLAKSRSAELISIYIGHMCNECVTDKDKEDLLECIPDSIKCKFKIMQILHSDHYSNVQDLISGSIDIAMIFQAFKILCLYTSKSIADDVLKKYKAKLPLHEFNGLFLLFNTIFERRQIGVLNAISHIQTITGKMYNASSVMTCDVPSAVLSASSEDFFESPYMKNRIRTVRQKKRVNKSHKQPTNKVEYIKFKLLDGSLALEDILASRKFLLDSRIPKACVSRWFRTYKDKICTSNSICDEDKCKLFSEIEESKNACKHFVMDDNILNPQVADIIVRVKSGNVQLQELSRIKHILVSELGYDRTAKLFMSLKSKLLKKSLGAEAQINEAFLSIRHRNIHGTSYVEDSLIRAIADGTLPVTELTESIDSLLKIRSCEAVKSLIYNYIVRLIDSGVPHAVILRNLPVRFRAMDKIIMACSMEDHDTVQAIRYGALPFSDLERAANVAAQYFSPYVLFGMLLRYAYNGRSLSASEQTSFHSLLASLEAEGVISVNRSMTIPMKLQSKSSISTRQEKSTSVLELFERPYECASVDSFPFEHRSRCGIDIELERVLELDVDGPAMTCDGLLYYVDVGSEELLSSFQY